MGPEGQNASKVLGTREPKNLWPSGSLVSDILVPRSGFMAPYGLMVKNTSTRPGLLAPYGHTVNNTSTRPGFLVTPRSYGYYFVSRYLYFDINHLTLHEILCHLTNGNKLSIFQWENMPLQMHDIFSD